MKDAQIVLWAGNGDEELPSSIHTEYEVERELPGEQAFRIYGCVDVRGIGYDPRTGGPEVLEATIYVRGVSYWPAGATDARDLTSLDEAAALTGMSAAALGDLVYDAYMADLEDRACV
jgi:hypothetical protein